jgi:hypothetical protein
MHNDLDKLDREVANCVIFKHMAKEKLEELSDAIYMSAVRSNLKLEDVLGVLRNNKAFDEKFFSMTKGNVFDLVGESYRQFSERLFHKKAGGGTPNAAIGKAELLLLFMSTKTSKPRKGDILFCGRNIEIKTNGGKLGLGRGDDANKSAVEFCKEKGITLRMGASGVAAKQQPIFDPTREDDRKMVGENLSGVIGAWWKGLCGANLSVEGWEGLRRAFLEEVAKKHIVSPEVELLVFALDGRFIFFKDAKCFVDYYDVDQSKFEYRAYQKNPFSIYLDVIA